MRSVRFDFPALVEYNEWAFTDVKVFKKLARLIEEIERNPFQGSGKPEPLKANYKGYWSRRITDKDRLLYKVTDSEILIISCKGHYE